jgi:hypothetical protein
MAKLPKMARGAPAVNVRSGTSVGCERAGDEAAL